jgi:hypothetical protein
MPATKKPSPRASIKASNMRGSYASDLRGERKAFSLLLGG